MRDLTVFFSYPCVTHRHNNVNIDNCMNYLLPAKRDLNNLQFLVCKKVPFVMCKDNSVLKIISFLCIVRLSVIVLM